MHRPNLHPIILLPIGDGNADFRLASNLKTAWLGSTCQGYNPRRYSLQGHRGTKASPPRQGSNNRGGFFFMLCVFFVFFCLFVLVFFMFVFFFKSSLDLQPFFCGSWFWHPLYQFLVCSLLSSSTLGHIHLINQATDCIQHSSVVKRYFAWTSVVFQVSRLWNCGPDLYPFRVTEGIMGVYPSSLHVFCRLGKGLRPRSARDSVGGAEGVWGIQPDSL